MISLHLMSSFGVALSISAEGEARGIGGVLLLTVSTRGTGTLLSVVSSLSTLLGIV